MLYEYLGGYEAGELDVGCDDWGKTILAAIGSYQASQPFEMCLHCNVIPGQRLDEEENTNAENVCFGDQKVVSYPSKQRLQCKGFVSQGTFAVVARHDTFTGTSAIVSQEGFMKVGHETYGMEERG